VSLAFSRPAQPIRVSRAAIAILALTTIGCGGGGDGGGTQPQCSVTSVVVTPPTLSVVSGLTGTLTAVVTQSNCTNLVTNWSTSNASIASVSSAGVVTGLAVGGPVTITAIAGGASGSAQVTVTPAQVPIANITLSQTTAGVAVGQTLQLTATPRDAGGNTLTGRTIAWSSSNSNIVTVTQTGLVVGVASGQATVTAAAEGKTATATITVTNTPVASVAVTPNGAVLQPAATLQLSALTKDQGGSVLSGRTVTWSTSNAGIASVTTNGLVTAVGAGTATITATSEGVSGTALIVTAGASSNRFAFAHANQPSTQTYTPATADQFASGGGQISVIRQSDGVYDVTLPNMAKGAGQREIVLVTSTGGSNINCQIGSWNNSNANIVARVYCFSTTGLAADGQFSIVVAESRILAGRFGFAWADQPTTDTYNPNPSYADNSSGGAVTITRTNTGDYTVRWAGLARTAGQLEETVMVGAYGSAPRRCNVVSWEAFATADLTAVVRCTDLNGAPADSRFVATIVDRGRAARRYGLTWADQPTSPIYTTTNNNYSRTSTAGATSVSRMAAGNYLVRLGGQARTGASPETVLVTSYGSTAYCKASQWAGNGADMLVTVLCFDPAGNLADTRFTVLLLE
jgi:uncharacterized protein YjdB